MKKYIIILITALLIISIIPTSALADEVIDGSVTPQTFDLSTISEDGQTVTVKGNVTLTGTKKVKIVCEAGANLTLENVNIDNSGTADACALSFTDTGNTLTLTGSNRLVSGANQPGVKVEDTSVLTIKGSGELIATGGENGGGIGSAAGIGTGRIYIESGRVVAKGGVNAGGIGGGDGSSWDNLIISGGEVYADRGSEGYKDIGAKVGEMSGFYNIYGKNAALFMRNGMHGGSCRGASYTSYNTQEISGGKVYHYDMPNGWSDGEKPLAVLDTNVYVDDTFIAEHGNVIDLGYYYYHRNIKIETAAPVTVKGTGETREYFSIEGIVSGIDLTIQNVNYSGWEPLIFPAGANKLTLIGENRVECTGYSPAVWVRTGIELTIQGSGSLTAIGGDCSPGIGGNYNGWPKDAGSITILSGDITAVGASNAAGIGGAYQGSCNEVIISGGKVTATGGENGAGIGGGKDAQGCSTITISGGEVTATGGIGRAGLEVKDTSGVVNISGGRVIATGGTDAAGIGGGNVCGTVNITGGVVFADGSGGNDIGANKAGTGGTLNISGDTAVFLKSNTTSAAVNAPEHEMDSSQTIMGGMAYKHSVPSAWSEGETANAYVRHHDVTVNVSGNGTATRSGLYTMIDHYDMDITVTPDVGHHLEDITSSAGHTIADNGNGSFAISDITADDTVDVMFAINLYDVTFNSRGGSDVSTMIDVPHGSLITKPEDPVRENLNFAGWYKDSEYKEKWDFGSDPVIDDMTLYARWTADVNINKGEHGNVNLLAKTVDCGEDITITVTSDVGYHLEDITSSAAHTIADNENGTYTIKNITAHDTVDVMFAINLYDVTFDSRGGSDVSTLIDVPHGSLIDKPEDPTRESLTFAGWYKDTGYTEPWDFANDPVTDDMTLYAKWTADVDVSTSEHGSVDTTAKTVVYGDDLMISATPEVGYHVQSVTSSAGHDITDNGDGTYTIKNITAHDTVDVLFEINIYGVGINIGRHGSVSPDGVQEVPHGDDLIITPTPNEHYHMDSVTSEAGFAVTENEDGTYAIENITSEDTISVTFEIDKHTVKYSCDADLGAMDGKTRETVNYSASPTSTPIVVEEEGYSCIGWSADGGVTIYKDLRKYTVKGDVAFEAQFKPVSADETPTDDRTYSGDISGVLEDSNGNPLVGYKIILHSDPITAVTDSQGLFTFKDVPYTEHTLLVKNPKGIEIDRFSVSFEGGEIAKANVDNDNQSIAVTYEDDTVEVCIPLYTNMEQNGVKAGKDIETVELNKPEQPAETKAPVQATDSPAEPSLEPEDEIETQGNSFVWVLLIILGIAIAGAAVFMVAFKKQRKIEQ